MIGNNAIAVEWSWTNLEDVCDTSILSRRMTCERHDRADYFKSRIIDVATLFVFIPLLPFVIITEVQFVPLFFQRQRNQGNKNKINHDICVSCESHVGVCRFSFSLSRCCSTALTFLVFVHCYSLIENNHTPQAMARAEHWRESWSSIVTDHSSYHIGPNLRKYVSRPVSILISIGNSLINGRIYSPIYHKAIVSLPEPISITRISNGNYQVDKNVWTRQPSVCFIRIVPVILGDVDHIFVLLISHLRHVTLEDIQNGRYSEQQTLQCSTSALSVVLYRSPTWIFDSYTCYRQSATHEQIILGPDSWSCRIVSTVFALSNLKRTVHRRSRARIIPIVQSRQSVSRSTPTNTASFCRRSMCGTSQLYTNTRWWRHAIRSQVVVEVEVEGDESLSNRFDEESLSRMTLCSSSIKWWRKSSSRDPFLIRQFSSLQLPHRPRNGGWRLAPGEEVVNDANEWDEEVFIFLLHHIASEIPFQSPSSSSILNWTSMYPHLLSLWTPTG